MKLKTEEVNGKTYAVVDSNGRVLYDNDGKEFAFDAAQTYGKIQELTNESKTHREARESAEAKVALFKDIDPAKYKEAVDALSKIDQKKLIDAGEVDKVKESIAQSYEQKLAEERKALDTLRAQYEGEKLTAAFASSKYINEQLAVPPDMAKATFGSQFKIDNGQIKAYDAHGNLIYSRVNPGSPADFEEAFTQIVEGYQYKDRILKASNQNGTGGDQKGGGPKKTYTRAQFNELPANEQAKVALDARENKAAIVD